MQLLSFRSPAANFRSYRYLNDDFRLLDLNPSPESGYSLCPPIQFQIADGRGELGLFPLLPL
jgi:hypothetical protein